MRYCPGICWEGLQKRRNSQSQLSVSGLSEYENAYNNVSLSIKLWESKGF
jgi:hypothetical protein